MVNQGEDVRPDGKKKKKKKGGFIFYSKRKIKEHSSFVRSFAVPNNCLKLKGEEEGEEGHAYSSTYLPEIRKNDLRYQTAMSRESADIRFSEPVDDDDDDDATIPPPSPPHFNKRFLHAHFRW